MGRLKFSCRGFNGDDSSRSESSNDSGSNRDIELGGSEDDEAEREQREQGGDSKCSSGHFNHSLYPGKAEEEIKLCCKMGLLHPDGPLYCIWQRVTLLAVAVCALYAPFQFGFLVNPSVGVMAFDAVVSIIFFVDGAITFRLSFRHKKSLDLCISKKAIAARYIGGGFFFDLLGSLPLNLIHFGATGHPASGALGHFFRFLPCLRLYRIPEIYHFLSLLGRANRTLYFAIRVFKLLLNIILASHYFGIAYFWMTTLEPDPANTWIGQGIGPDWPSMPIFLQYVATMWWSIFVITSIGPAYTSVTTAEQIFSSFYALFGMAALAYTLGTLTVLMVKESSKTMQYHDDLDALRNYAARHRLPRAMEEQLKQQLSLQYHLKKTETASFLQEFPRHLRAAVSRQLYLPIVEDIEIFRGCSKAFLKQIVSEMEMEIVMPNDAVTFEGDVATHLFVVVSGRLVREEGPAFLSRQRKPAILRRGAVFGKTAVLFDMPQLFTVRAVESSQLLTLSKPILSAILKAFPNDCATVLENLKQRVRKEGSREAFGMERSASEACIILKDSVNSSPSNCLVASIVADQEEETCMRVCAAASQGNFEQLRSMIEKSPKLACCTNYNLQTPLHLATSHGHVECMRLLVENGAEVNALDMHGATPLLDAAKSGQESAMEWLQSRGALLLLSPEDSGATLCRLAATAAASAGMAAASSPPGNRYHLRSNLGQQAGSSGSADLNYLQRLLACGADPNSTDYAGFSALHVACLAGNAIVAKALIEKGANPQQEDRAGRTPLMLAEASGSTALLALMRN